MAIEIVDLPIKNGDFPQQTVKLPEATVVMTTPGDSRPGCRRRRHGRHERKERNERNEARRCR